MLYNAREGHVPMGSTAMDYVTFGKGRKALVVIPGLTDGLKTVHGMALPLALSLRLFAKHFRVFVFSRKNALEPGYTTEDMARDQKRALDVLGITRCHVMGVSQGGMIAQHLASLYPETVERLVLAISTARAGAALKDVVAQWICMAEAGDYMHLVTDTCEKVYSPKRLKLYRPFYPLIGRIGKPKDFSRFIIQAYACRAHDARNTLENIKCPTLVIGGGSDRVVGNGASRELAACIAGSKLVVYEELGHGANEESKDFYRQVLRFLLQAQPMAK